MAEISLTIDDKEVITEAGKTVLQAALEAGIYIPTLCSHPDLPNFTTVKPSEFIYRGEEKIITEEHSALEGGCMLCLIQMEGEEGLFFSCQTEAKPGMKISTSSPEIQEERRKALATILVNHPHACLTCAQREGCTREPCSTSVKVEERCCVNFGNCELQKVAEYIGIPEDTGRYIPQNLPIIKDDPLYNRNFNLCIGCLRCVRACNSLRENDVLGFVVKDGRVIVGPKKAPMLREADCRFCGACVEVCPTGALTDKIKITESNREETLVPCSVACPAGIDIPRFVNYIAKSDFDKAIAVVRERVPLPSVLGAVCFHPCEVKCRRGEVNEPVAICSLKRFVAENDRGIWKEKRKKLPPTGKKVAIIGSGPAGLVSAYYLATLGHEITIFEKENKPGGMLRAGIPYYRLTEETLQKDIDGILELGINLKTGVKVGDELKLSDIKNRFDAMFIAVGSSLSRKINIEGTDADNVLWGVGFLRDASMQPLPLVKDRVVVIGGGNVAIDVAMTALRLGAKDVQMVCLEKKEEMPAHKWEISQAEEEGIKINVSWGPKRILKNNGCVSGIELVRCVNVFDDNRRFNPSFNENELKTIECDGVILAIGQASDLSIIEDMPDIRTSRGIIETDKDQYTGVDGIFAGGDVAMAPGSVIDAVRMGRNAAIAVDKYLGGEGNIEEVLTEPESRDPKTGKAEGFGNWSRACITCIPVDKRKNNFNLVEQIYNKEEAIKEASRCLQCDLRLQICGIKSPPEHYLEFNAENVGKVPEVSGVYQLLGNDKKVISIKGAMNIRQALDEAMQDNKNAVWFEWEADEMFTKRESELIQQYMQKYGEMPSGGMDELDDLF